MYPCHLTLPSFCYTIREQKYGMSVKAMHMISKYGSKMEN